MDFGMSNHQIECYKIELPPGIETGCSVEWLLAIAQASLSPEWSWKLISRYPPVVCQQKNRYLLIGGLSSYGIAKQTFPNEKIPVRLENGCIDNPLFELYQTELANLVTNVGGQSRLIQRFMKDLWSQFPPSQWSGVSEQLTTKRGFGQLTGINRRSLVPKTDRENPESEFRKISE